jgi:hypothetical protein
VHDKEGVGFLELPFSLKKSGVENGPKTTA